MSAPKTPGYDITGKHLITRGLRVALLRRKKLIHFDVLSVHGNFALLTNGHHHLDRTFPCDTLHVVNPVALPVDEVGKA